MALIKRNEFDSICRNISLHMHMPSVHIANQILYLIHLLTLFANGLVSDIVRGLIWSINFNLIVLPICLFVFCMDTFLWRKLEAHFTVNSLWHVSSDLYIRNLCVFPLFIQHQLKRNIFITWKIDKMIWLVLWFDHCCVTIYNASRLRSNTYLFKPNYSVQSIRKYWTNFIQRNYAPLTSSFPPITV